MIRSVRNKPLKRFVENGDRSKLSVKSIERLITVLRQLDAAKSPEQMNVPGFYFHALKGQEKGRYSVRVTANYRMTFGWQGKDAIDVDLEDYH